MVLQVVGGMGVEVVHSIGQGIAGSFHLAWGWVVLHLLLRGIPVHEVAVLVLPQIEHGNEAEWDDKTSVDLDVEKVVR